MSASHHQGPAPSSHSLGDPYPDEDVEAEMSDDDAFLGLKLYTLSGIDYDDPDFEEKVAQEQEAAWIATSGVQPGSYTGYSRYDDEQIEPRGKKEPAPSPAIKPEFEEVSRDPSIETYIGPVTRQFPNGKRNLPVSLKGTKRSQRSTGTTLAGGNSAAGQTEPLAHSTTSGHPIGPGGGSGYGGPSNANTNGWAGQTSRDDGGGSGYRGITSRR